MAVIFSPGQDIDEVAARLREPVPPPTGPGRDGLDEPSHGQRTPGVVGEVPGEGLAPGEPLELSSLADGEPHHMPPCRLFW
jgi:hypothetical protein